jgi:hypothetical protein
MSDMIVDFEPLKNAKEIFGKLRRGYHYCNADGATFNELREYEDAYKKAFGFFGYSLHRNGGDSIDYYYMQQTEDVRAAGDGTEDRSNTSFRMTVLVAALYDSAATNSSANGTRVLDILSGVQSVERSFFDSVFDDTVAADRLSRFEITRAEVAKIVKQMMMFNYVREEDNGKLRFLPPVRRVLDTVQRLAAKASVIQSTQVAGAA